MSYTPNVLYAEERGHLFVEEAAAGAIRLDPFAVEDELGDGALADVGDDLFGGAGSGLDVDLSVGNGVLCEEAFGSAAVAAPGGRVDDQFHSSILADSEGFYRIIRRWAGSDNSAEVGRGATGGVERAAIIGAGSGGWGWCVIARC